ncbi:MAG: UDP-N-acetylmuramoyl-L-alanyl-D-glutamate--2,6-diaminopimelate ligase [Planctomycetota bacterium]|jgi:UDP-N-acetylmuramoyl-L-alanyl-D-glutamate--2,6-diaminopimelate ligase
MTFEQLLALVTSKNPPAISTDSRLIKAGDIFAAIKGASYDGHDFIGQAIQKNAKYILCQKLPDKFTSLSRQCDIITAADPAEAAAVLAQASRGNPASKLTNLAVTGTNGKTTVAFLVRSIIQQAGQRCGLIGTVIYDTSLTASQATLTTPDCLLIAEKQQQMVSAGAKFMVIEASSHALYQNRLAAVTFKAAAFTNLTGDHLDYHKTKDQYLAAKCLLFERLSPDATAVLNAESTYSPLIAKKTKAKTLSFAIDKPAALKADVKLINIQGSVFEIEYAGQRQEVTTPLPGKYNVSNCLAAAGLCLTTGFDLKSIAKGLSALQTVPGRLERVDANAEFTILIDYAHTDDALKNVLSTLKTLCEGKLIVVFGCGGDRDKTKRPRMARVAEDLADIVIVTTDNPRTEEPAAIIGEIAAGFEYPTADKISFELQRKNAIELAIKKADKGDIILLAGKGHEDYQIIGNKKIPFSDKEVAKDCLKRLT